MRALRRFLRREDGSATVELAILLPLILWPFMVGAELGFLQMRQAMLERAMDIVVRDLRLGKADVADAEAVKTAMCERIAIMPHCARDLTLDMRPVSLRGFTAPTEPPTCVDRSDEVAPATSFRSGTGNELMMLRFCILHDPFFPGAGLGRDLSNDGAGFALIARTFYVVEPR